MNQKYSNQLKLFSYAILVFQFFIMILYGLYVRYDSTIPSGHLNQYYPWYQDVNVMMLVGFGYLMSFVHSNGWGSMAFTFLVNAVVVQYYLLFQGLWEKAFIGSSDHIININMINMMQSSFAVAAVLISLGAVIGRITPLQLLIMALIQIIGYSLNEKLLSGGVLNVLDVGGSMIIHIYGAYFGLTFSYILGRISNITQKQPTANYVSYIFGLIGTVFLWMYWPSFNSGTSSYNLGTTSPEYQRLITITNTIFSLVGSCLSAFSFSIIFRGSFHMDDILNATLAGGVAMGSSANLILNPAGSLIIGTLAGIVSTYGFRSISHFMTKIGVYDTCGIHNLHAIPGLIGGISSAVVIAVYKSAPIQNGIIVDFAGINYMRQGGIQLAGTLISIFCGIFFGSVAGIIIMLFYKVEQADFFQDSPFFQIPVEQNADPQIQREKQKELLL